MSKENKTEIFAALIVGVIFGISVGIALAMAVWSGKEWPPRTHEKDIERGFFEHPDGKVWQVVPLSTHVVIDGKLHSTKPEVADNKP